MNKLIAISLVVIAFMSAMLVHGLVILPEMRRAKALRVPTFEEKVRKHDEEVERILEEQEKILNQHRSNSEDD